VHWFSLQIRRTHKEGWLMKEDPTSKIFRRRYFVLHHNKLQYFEMMIKKTIPLVGLVGHSLRCSLTADRPLLLWVLLLRVQRECRMDPMLATENTLTKSVRDPASSLLVDIPLTFASVHTERRFEAQGRHCRGGHLPLPLPHEVSSRRCAPFHAVA
jgi:hypothetical protein